MDKLWHFRSPQEFDLFLLQEGRALAEDVSKNLQLASMSNFPVQLGQSTVTENPSKTSEGYLASILFMGPVFGEFMISISRTTAETVFAELLKGVEESQKSQLIGEALAEVLNQSAGKRMRSLNEVFKRMTMSVPKVTEGKVMYRSIRSARTDIKTQAGDVDVSLYIDQMKTDLADAHREMIEQLKKTNLDLEKVNDQIKQQQIQLVQSEKMASLGLMAAGVAHEINNPLSFVMANTDTLSAYVEVTTRLIGSYSNFIKHLIQSDRNEAKSEMERIKSLEQNEEIAYITQDSQKLIEESRGGLERIRRIVSGLKRFSHQDQGEIKLAQVNDEIINTLELLRNELKYKCKIETSLKPVRELNCIPSELSQVFMNVIMNAAQAMPESGGKIQIETFEEGDQLVIRISDNGAGMSQEVMDKIFQPFFTTKPIGKGTGLGLAISFGIVERHGGKIQVESQVGQGSQFTIRLPYVS